MSGIGDRIRELHDSSVLRAATGLGGAEVPGSVPGGAVEKSAPAGARRPVIGVIGGDVPIEIIEACGAHAFRVSAADREIGREAVELLGTTVDSTFHSILDRILAGEFGFLRGLIVSRDCQASLRLFYVLRMLAKQGRAVPDVHLVDLLHLPRESTRDYNAGQLAQLADTVAAWTGTEITATALHEAREVRGRLGSALRALRASRAEGAVPGATALRLYALAQTDAPADCLTWVTALLDEHGSSGPGLDTRTATTVTGGTPGRPAGSRLRVFLTGSTVDRVPVYDGLESAGVLIAGEDHNWGDPVADLWDIPTAATDLPTAYTALAEHRLRLGPMAQASGLSDRARFSAACARRCGAQVVLSVGRRNDPAPGWDRPGLIRELGPDMRVVALPIAAHIWSADELGTAVELLIREDYEVTAR
ncbi:2-hydroxyacyl-CoA dehydratase family protein [Nocardia carnea]|uniref:2-hydroxyacyl-CoA dehydratase family protein n=1 Tax=Nocardia carnea TaxID=37328 RepID=UPI0024586EF6|nr:2-hydroxyacyl-CoA dehydratase family protein [Nocardia carnea]